MNKIIQSEYVRRKLAHISKKRARKKFLRDLESHWFGYCVARWGLSGALYAMYHPELISSLVYSENPLIALITKADTFSGAYYPVPLEYETN